MPAEDDHEEILPADIFTKGRAVQILTTEGHWITGMVQAVSSMPHDPEALGVVYLAEGVMSSGGSVHRHVPASMIIADHSPN